jgi:hypothetical protein
LNTFTHDYFLQIRITLAALSESFLNDFSDLNMRH